MEAVSMDEAGGRSGCSDGARGYWAERFPTAAARKREMARRRAKRGLDVPGMRKRVERVEEEIRKIKRELKAALALRKRQ